MPLRTPRPTHKRDPVERLADDDRTFEIECVRSSLEFHNRVIEFGNQVWGGLLRPLDSDEYYKSSPAPGPKDAPVSDICKSASEAFAWLPEVLKRRAARARIPASNVPRTIAPVNEYFTDRLCAELEALIMLLQGAHVRHQDIRDLSEHIDVLLDGVAIYQRLRFIEGKPTPVNLPILRDAGNCLGYVMMVLVQNRWGLIGRVRECRYVTRPGKDQPHLFLDYRIDNNGRLKRGTPLEFCRPEHANRFRQREWRRRQTKKTQTEKAKQKVRRKAAGG
jgi:hypothetical protein